MEKISLDDLKKIRETKRAEMARRDESVKDITIIIGMGTCGIAAGAKDAFDAFIDELNKLGVESAKVQQTGCMGLCYSEPTVEVRVPGMPNTIYGNVDGKVARQIVQKHIISKSLVDDHIFDKPSTDIVG